MKEKTPVGVLCASTKESALYPGIVISLEDKEGNKEPIVMAEYSDGVLRIVVWDNTENDEVSHTIPIKM